MFIYEVSTETGTLCVHSVIYTSVYNSLVQIKDVCY